jgi:hypothetical protein
VWVKDRDLHSAGGVGVHLQERYADLSGVSIDLNMLDNIGIGMDDPLAFLQTSILMPNRLIF